MLTQQRQQRQQRQKPEPTREFMKVEPHFTWNEFHLPYNQVAQIQPIIDQVTIAYADWYNEQLRQQKEAMTPTIA